MASGYLSYSTLATIMHYHSLEGLTNHLSLSLKAVENKYMYIKEGREGINWETGIDMFILLCNE